MDTKGFSQLFDSFSSLKVLIIGDVMIDSYLFGSVNRISPEAPVPILEVEKQQDRLGGAANVALNVKALGAKPILCGITGQDVKGDLFKELLLEQGMSTDGILDLKERRTTLKTRVIGSGQQVLRVDEEDRSPIGQQDQELFLTLLDNILSSQQIDLILFEDYDKGLLSESLIKKIIEKAQKSNILTAVDPKKRNFLFYRGVTLFKPNLKELQEGLKLDLQAENISQIKSAVESLKDQINVNNVLITLSEYGAYYMSENKSGHISAHLRNISDVSGAGDTVITVAALCLARGVDIELLAQISNIAGGLVCESVGVVPVSKEALYEECVQLLSSNN